MNILIYDEQQALCHLIRSALGAAGYRSSISSDPRDAVLKLDTGLFDLVIVGPDGTRREMAEYLQEELPHTPLLLAGMNCEAEGHEQIRAVLDSPLHLDTLVTEVRRIELALEKTISDLGLTILGGDGSIACRASEINRKGMLVECSGDPEEFHSFFLSTAEDDPLTAKFSKKERLALPISLRYIDHNPARIIQRVGVSFEEINEENWDVLSQKA